MRIIVVFLIAMPFAVSDAQNFIKVSPAGMNPSHAQVLPSGQGYDLYFWSLQKGYRLDHQYHLDTIRAYYSWWCGMPLEYAEHWLQHIARSSNGTMFSVYERGGCIVEGITHVFRDSTGSVFNSGEVITLDDFMGNGMESKLAVSPFNPNKLYYVWRESLYVSTDGGHSMNPASSPDPAEWVPFLNILVPSPFDSNTILVGGWDQYAQVYKIYKTADGGNSWEGFVVGTRAYDLVLHPTDPAIMWVEGDEGVFRSSDGGQTWQATLTEDCRSLAVDASNPDEVWAGTSEGDLLRSTDGGVYWQPYNNSFSISPIHELYKVPGTDTMIAASHEGIFKVFGPGVVSVESPSTKGLSWLLLYSNFPNPFNPHTTIMFSNAIDAHLEMVIYNSLGQRVATLLAGFVPRGYHHAMWDASGMGAGVYICRLKGEGVSRTQKLLLIK